jgi:hypothetical protein
MGEAKRHRQQGAKPRAPARRPHHSAAGHNNSFIGAKRDRKLERNDPGLFGKGPEWWVGDDFMAIARRVKRWWSSRHR